MTTVHPNTGVSQPVHCNQPFRMHLESAGTVLPVVSHTELIKQNLEV